MKSFAIKASSNGVACRRILLAFQFGQNLRAPALTCDDVLFLVGIRNSGPPNTNPPSGREEDLNPGPLDYKSSALTTSRCLLDSSCESFLSRLVLKVASYMFVIHLHFGSLSPALKWT